MTRVVRIATGYQPRPQQKVLHLALKRFSVLVCHRRFGKTVLAINELIHRALVCKEPKPRLAYVAPLYRQAKQVAWDYLKFYTQAIPGVVKNESELRVELPNGARIQLLGAENPDALRGLYLDGVVLDEFAQMTPKAWSEVIRPALADRGGFALFIGTPKGRNAFCQLYEQARDGQLGPEWFASLNKASESGVLSAAELESAKLQMDPDEYRQEFECAFEAAIAGAYYGKYLAAADSEGRIGKVPWEPRLPVITAWDLGIDDATSIWFAQSAGRELRIIDYYEASGVGLEHYAKVLGEKPYSYGEHLLPHDVEVTELSTGKSRYAMLASLGIRAKVVPRAALEDGIVAARGLLARSWFDRERCQRGIEALRQYRREWDAALGAFKARPLHDWASHAADAFRYLALGISEKRAEGPKAGRQNTDYDPFSYGLNCSPLRTTGFFHNET